MVHWQLHPPQSELPVIQLKESEKPNSLYLCILSSYHYWLIIIYPFLDGLDSTSLYFLEHGGHRGGAGS